ncbi:hypothetical protein ISF_04966 [Cordyceps fumosorosea ARSEF 2679]|uniref:Uncharacterized protein n=1 Tax=Cordyceps fumosorosea (strain ARSEF 2679) TaxID=1081104 RepID=A0A167VXJ2_CORFA|nr:hypothetical protein ISF_04966 [Cordyceps fumosorosea ARSEF 2679]OAA63090.1 hypothetical protein ISF_04966 [Cordyceps fumosorosea ARSEF 2679]
MYTIATLACALGLAVSVQASPLVGRESGDVANDWDRPGCAEARRHLCSRQGALCAHKNLDALVNEHARGQLIALVTFGDPVSVWSDTLRFPRAAGQRGAALDWPRSPRAFVDKLEAVWREYSDADLDGAQKAAMGDLVVQLTGQAKSRIWKLGKDILAGHICRWMLMPQHFVCGLGQHAMTARATEDVARIFQQSK